MQVLLDTKKQLQEQAEANLDGEAKEMYIEALNDMLNALSEYF